MVHAQIIVALAVEVYSTIVSAIRIYASHDGCPLSSDRDYKKEGQYDHASRGVFHKVSHGLLLRDQAAGK